MQIYTPCGDIVQETHQRSTAARRQGARIGVLDNGKPNARLVMEHLGQRMAERLGGQLGLVTDKGPGRNAATPCDPQVIDRLRSDVDMVLVGSAD